MGATKGKTPKISSPSAATVAKTQTDTGLARTGAGRARARPELGGAPTRRPRGDTLVIWKLDRLGRSLAHLLEVIEDLRGRGCHFRCLTSPI
ncbi:hypothetical protein GAY28_06500, partial [Azospirillum brasilense]|nr:hypothetical protein [Azospirillum brasilense]